jgi:hypothetical protein
MVERSVCPISVARALDRASGFPADRPRPAAHSHR